jgi:hypothetical protein
MKQYPLKFINNHLFIAIDESLWLIDTGSPSSFGETNHITLDNLHFDIAPELLGTKASVISESTGVPCQGLIGEDILVQFDHLFDLKQDIVTLSKEELPIEGTMIPLVGFMGIPMIKAEIAGKTFQMVFDTGAQISYLQDEVTSTFPSTGVVEDFHPIYGDFTSESYDVVGQVENLSFTFRCGILPEVLGLSVSMANAQGVIGNSIMKGRILGYFPRRSLLTIV